MEFNNVLVRSDPVISSEFVLVTGTTVTYTADKDTANGRTGAASTIIDNEYVPDHNGGASSSSDSEEAVSQSTSKRKTRCEKEGYRCSICGNQYSALSSFHRHKATHSGNPKPFSCEICGTRFTQSFTLVIHKRNVHGHDGGRFTPHSCKFCNEKFEKPFKMYDHVLRNHEEEVVKRDGMYPCDTCSKIFVDAPYRDRHSKICHEWTCQFCKKEYFEERYFERHMRRTHGRLTPRAILCPVCGVANCTQCITKKSHPDIWDRLSTKERRPELTCELCGKQLRTNCSLVGHMRIHSNNPKPFACDICGKRYTLRYNVRQHMLKVHQVREHSKPKQQTVKSANYFCDTCGKQFSCMSHLKRHKKHIHNFEDQDQGRRENVNMHIRVHKRKPSQRVPKRKSHGSNKAKDNGSAWQRRCHICHSKEEFRTNYLYKRHLIEKHTKRCSVRMSRCQITEVKIEDLSTEQSKQIPLNSNCVESFISNEFRQHQALLVENENDCQLQARITTVIANACDSNSFGEGNLNPKTELHHVVEERDDNFLNDFSSGNDNFKDEVETCSPMPIVLENVEPEEDNFESFVYEDVKSDYLPALLISETESEPLQLDLDDSTRISDRIYCTICKCFIVQQDTTIDYHNEVFHKKMPAVSARKLMFLPILALGFLSLAVIPPTKDNYHIPWYMCCKCGKAHIYKYKASIHKRRYCRNKGFKLNAAPKTPSTAAENQGVQSKLITKDLMDLKRILEGSWNAKFGDWTDFWELPTITKADKEMDPIFESIEGIRKVKCKICEKVLQRSSIKEHIRSHNREQYVCQYCGLVLAKQITYKDHLNIHTGEKPYKCRFCDKAFANSTARYLHENSVHEKGKIAFPCKTCGKTFRRYELLQHHRVSVHEEGRAFVCDKCPQVFRLVQKFKEHLRSNHPEFGRPVAGQFLCDRCEQSFTTQAHLHDHITWVHSIQKAGPRKYTQKGRTKKYRPAQCVECGKTVKEEKTLKRHMLVFHPKDGKRPKFFECKICHHSYSIICTIRTHLRTKHVDVLPAELLEQNKVTVNKEEHGERTLDLEDYFLRLPRMEEEPSKKDGLETSTPMATDVNRAIKNSNISSAETATDTAAAL